MNAPPKKRSYAFLDVSSRRRKARKILRILEHIGPLEGKAVLEVGAGSGVISATLAEAVGPAGRAVAVDVVDQRVAREGYAFVRVGGTELPFEDGAFDLVVSNHVMEHVGDRGEQMRHLAEIARVLAPGGAGYLAVPNRWLPLEPHFKLWLLSWLPRPLRSPYVRMAGKGTHYDCHPPGPIDVRRMLSRSGFGYRDCFVDAVRAVAARETPSAALRLLSRTPRRLLALLSPLAPTMIFLIEAGRAAHGREPTPSASSEAGGTKVEGKA
jgi:SAM-dependent methyltransferase